MWVAATQTEIAWPWYCAISFLVNVPIALVASLLLDGRQSELSVYTIKGQKNMYREQNLPEKQYTVLYHVDPAGKKYWRMKERRRYICVRFLALKMNISLS